MGAKSRSQQQATSFQASIDGGQIDHHARQAANAPANNVLAGPSSGGSASPVTAGWIAADLPNATTTNKALVFLQMVACR